MITTLIIEDEYPAAERLKKLLLACNPDINILDCLDSIESSVDWFENNPSPDLVLLDIQLADGKSFDIFKQVTISSFVIFTTAYDEFALKAFELNSIDYLLKPIRLEMLQKSLDKFEKIKSANNGHSLNIDQVIDIIEHKNTSFKKRFVINIGNHIKVVDTEEIAYIFSKEKYTFIKTNEGKDYPIDFSLDTLEDLLNPEMFFRINRQFFVSFKAISAIQILSKSRIKLKITPKPEEYPLVSSTKSPEFRKWLDK